MFGRPERSKALAEFIGTFAIVFFGCGAVMITERFPGSISASVIPVVFGLVVAVMIYATGHISGAHFNPAVSLAFAVARHFPRRSLLTYWLAQFLGALAAMQTLCMILPAGSHFGATLPSVPLYSALFWEIILTFFLMLVIVAVATDTRAEGTMAGAAIGGTVMLAAFVGGPITGASMNPARSLAPAIAEGSFSFLWIYFVGPCIGAVLAGITYQGMRREAEKKSDAKGCC